MVTMINVCNREKSSESEARTAEKSQSPPATGGAAQESLSVEETNKLRAKLGLKPLERAEKPAGNTLSLAYH